MASLEEAFNTYKNQNSSNDYMAKLLNKIPRHEESKYSSNSINHGFMSIGDTENRVKMSNSKYDKIIRGDRSIYGFVCKDCGGCLNYHMTIQNKFPHEFIKGKYKRLEDSQQGPHLKGFIL
jgi:hypothetical protein